MSRGVFLRMPYPARAAAVCAAGVVNRVVRYGHTYRRELELLRSTETAGEERLRDLQRERLRELLAEARLGSDHYRDVLGALSETELDRCIRDLDLSGLPFLEKVTIRSEPGRLRNRRRRTAARSATSGTTGTPMHVEHDRSSVQRAFALLHRQREWFGVRPRCRSVRLSGRHLLDTASSDTRIWLPNWAESQLLVSTYHLEGDALDAAATKVRAFAPELLEGYPSAVVQLAEALARKGPLPSLRAVVTTAEPLSDEVRAGIRSYLGVPVVQYYAASEGVPLIQECPAERLHLRLESGIFELIGPDGGAPGPGDCAELVVTSFRQLRTPLIRYRTGDFVVAGDGGEACPCGCSLPTVAAVVGRDEDLVLTRDGRRLGMFSYRTLKHVDGLELAQIVQESPVRFEVRAVLAPGADPRIVEARITEVFEKALGYRPEVVLAVGKEMIAGSRGKLRAVVREFPG